MTVSDYIFDFLAKKGCGHVFMVSGSSAMWLTDALKRNETLEAICHHHEQAAVMSADMRGRLTGIPGVALVTVGPGATNAVTGVAQAYTDSSPVIVLSGQASSPMLRYENETGIRQHGNQSLPLGGLVGSITKYFAEVTAPDLIIEHMERAYSAAVSGRPGPVWLDVPVDVQNMQVPGNVLAAKGIMSANPEQGKPDISVVKGLLSKSARPLILAGQGVRTAGACNLLKHFADKQRIPVITSRMGIDAIESDNPYFIGRPGAYGDRASHLALQTCDFLLVIGCRMSVSTIGYAPKLLAKHAKKTWVDIDPLELAKPDVPVDHKFNCDASVFLDLALGLESSGGHTQWLDLCRKWKIKYPAVLEEYASHDPINTYSFTKMLSGSAKNGDAVIVDTGSVCNIVSQTWAVKPEQRYLISGGLSCMGFWAGCTGAATAVPGGRNVIAITGDGSTQMNIQELATLAHNKLPVKLFIYSNDGYLLIKHNQHNYMNDRFLGVDKNSGVSMPDFIAVAKAYGLPAFRAEKDNAAAVIDKVLKVEGPAVCEVVCQPFQDIAPRLSSKVMPDGSLKSTDFEDLYPFLDEDELAGNINEALAIKI